MQLGKDKREKEREKLVRGWIRRGKRRRRRRKRMIKIDKGLWRG
jgi:hypothetical protein